MSCNFKLIHPLKSFEILNPTHPFYFWTKILNSFLLRPTSLPFFLFLETLVVALCENSDVQQRTFRKYQLKGDRKVILQKRKFTLKFKCCSAFAVFSVARYFAFHTKSPIRTSDSKSKSWDFVEVTFKPLSKGGNTRTASVALLTTHYNCIIIWRNLFLLEFPGRQSSWSILVWATTALIIIWKKKHVWELFCSKILPPCSLVR